MVRCHNLVVAGETAVAAVVNYELNLGVAKLAGVTGASGFPLCLLFACVWLCCFSFMCVSCAGKGGGRDMSPVINFSGKHTFVRNKKEFVRAPSRPFTSSSAPIVCTPLLCVHRRRGVRAANSPFSPVSSTFAACFGPMLRSVPAWLPWLVNG